MKEMNMSTKNVTLCLAYIRYYPGIIPSFISTGRVDVILVVVVIIAILIINVFLKQIAVPFNCTIKNVYKNKKYV